MEIYFNKLILFCKESKEVIDFKQLNFFHGKIGAGKSSIARLIKFCFGGKLERTPAIQSELLSVTLLLNLGEYEVEMERDATANEVQVTWIEEDKKITINAPIIPGDSAIWKGDIYNLNDLIYKFWDMPALKVRKNKSNEDAPMIRLSIKDWFWYSYLDQDDLDSTFFKLDDSARRSKSRDVMRMMVGYYSNKLHDLETELERLRFERDGKRNAVKKIVELQKRLNLPTLEVQENNIKELEKELNEFKETLANTEKDYKAETHFVDKIRDDLIHFHKKISSKKSALLDLDEISQEQNNLMNELYSMKAKITKSESASEILNGVKFSNCPQCGAKVKKSTAKEECNLCCNEIKQDKKIYTKALEYKNELKSRIEEIAFSIKMHEESRIDLSQELDNLILEKSKLDKELNKQLEIYDSEYMARIKTATAKEAELTEKIKSANVIKGIFSEVGSLNKELADLDENYVKVKGQLQGELDTFKRADVIISEIENEFISIMREVKYPGITAADSATVNRTTWIANVKSGDDEILEWSFNGAGSGGKKTLFNVCYLLALHKVAAKNKLPILEFIMIDTPMKNIGEDVNKEIFISFYKLLYKLANKELAHIQFIIIDKEFVPPKTDNLHIYERYMTPDEKEAPPLIRYYRGH